MSAELVIRSTGAGLFITAAGHVISGSRSVYYGADCFIPVRSVPVSTQHSSRLTLAQRPNPVPSVHAHDAEASSEISAEAGGGVQLLLGWEIGASAW